MAENRELKFFVMMTGKLLIFQPGMPNRCTFMMQTGTFWNSFPESTMFQRLLPGNFLQKV